MCAQVKADDEEAHHPDVVNLSDDDFESFVNNEELSLVKFYAPWCGHCKSLAPKYGEAASDLLKAQPPIKLAKVDCTKHKEACGKFGVSGYPTLKLFRNGEASDYSGPREADGIVKYMKKQVGPACMPLSTKKEIDAFKKSNKDTNYVVVGFFEKKYTPLYVSFTILTKQLRDTYTFGIVVNGELGKEYGISGDGLVAFYNWEDKQSVYAGSTKKADIQSWIGEKSLPVVGEYTEDTAKLYDSRDVPVAHFFVPVNWEDKKTMAYYSNRLKKGVAPHKGKLSVAFADLKKYEKKAKSFNIKDPFGMIIQHKVSEFVCLAG